MDIGSHVVIGPVRASNQVWHDNRWSRHAFPGSAIRYSSCRGVVDLIILTSASRSTSRTLTKTTPPETFLAASHIGQHCLCWIGYTCSICSFPLQDLSAHPAAIRAVRCGWTRDMQISEEAFALPSHRVLSSTCLSDFWCASGSKLDPSPSARHCL